MSNLFLSVAIVIIATVSAVAIWYFFIRGKLVTTKAQREHNAMIDELKEKVKGPEPIIEEEAKTEETEEVETETEVSIEKTA